LNKKDKLLYQFNSAEKALLEAKKLIRRLKEDELSDIEYENIMKRSEILLDWCLKGCKYIEKELSKK
jgi:hypothetical protein